MGSTGRDDLIGHREIAKMFGWETYMVYSMLELDHVPMMRTDDDLCVRRADLNAYIRKRPIEQKASRDRQVMNDRLGGEAWTPTMKPIHTLRMMQMNELGDPDKLERMGRLDPDQLLSLEEVAAEFGWTPGRTLRFWECDRLPVVLTEDNCYIKRSVLYERMEWYNYLRDTREERNKASGLVSEQEMESDLEKI